jgi:hypothetical protein
MLPGYSLNPRISSLLPSSCLVFSCHELRTKRILHQISVCNSCISHGIFNVQCIALIYVTYIHRELSTGPWRRMGEWISSKRLILLIFLTFKNVFLGTMYVKLRSWTAAIMRIPVSYRHNVIMGSCVPEGPKKNCPLPKKYKPAV